MGGGGGRGDLFFNAIFFVVYLKKQLITIPKWAQPYINTSWFQLYGCLKLGTCAYEVNIGFVIENTQKKTLKAFYQLYQFPTIFAWNMFIGVLIKLSVQIFEILKFSWIFRAVLGQFWFGWILLYFGHKRAPNFRNIQNLKNFGLVSYKFSRKLVQ